MAERTHDYPAKNVGRECGMRFLPKSFPNPANVYGLYLAAHENLELSHYLAKGLVPGNLFVPEYDPLRLPLVKRNARGVRVIPGKVAEAVRVIKAEQIPLLTFANLDFDGSVGTFRDDLLSLFTVFPADVGYLGVTSYCARDDGTLAIAGADISKFFSGLDDQTMFLRDFGTMLARHGALKRHLVGAEAPDHTHAGRTLGFLWWAAMGMGLVNLGPDGYGAFDRAYLDGPIDAVLARIAQRSAELSDRASDFHFVHEPELPELLRARKSALWPTDFLHLAWHTQNHQPMRTWWMRIERVDPADGQPTLQDVLQQVWKLAVRARLTFIDRDGTLVNIGE